MGAETETPMGPRRLSVISVTPWDRDFEFPCLFGDAKSRSKSRAVGGFEACTTRRRLKSRNNNNKKETSSSRTSPSLKPCSHIGFRAHGEMATGHSRPPGLSPTTSPDCPRVKDKGIHPSGICLSLDPHAQSTSRRAASDTGCSGVKDTISSARFNAVKNC
ncbi:hypothetical protein VTO42DRAFT_8461 [Malbranchea cinnamomea]